MLNEWRSVLPTVCANNPNALLIRPASHNICDSSYYDFLLSADLLQ